MPSAFILPHRSFLTFDLFGGSGVETKVSVRVGNVRLAASKHTTFVSFQTSNTGLKSRICLYHSAATVTSLARTLPRQPPSIRAVNWVLVRGCTSPGDAVETGSCIVLGFRFSNRFQGSGDYLFLRYGESR
jgi:hypothetical protein